MFSMKCRVPFLLALVLVTPLHAGDTRYVWTGVAHGARTTPPVTPDSSTRANPRATADALLAELADVELALAVDRDVTAAALALDELWARAARRDDYHARFDVLQELALARARLASLRGAEDESRATLAQLLPGDTLKSALGARFEFEPASEALLAAERAALAAPAFARQAANAGGGDARAWEKNVEAAVRVAVGLADVKAIQTIGPLAAPTLEKILLEMPDQLLSADVDPLTALVTVARARASTFLRANVNAGGLLWHQRILRAITTRSVLLSLDAWSYTGEDVPPVLKEAAWIEVLDALAADVNVRADLIGALTPLVDRDVLTPALQSMLVSALDGRDGVEAQRAAERVMQEPRGQATLRAVAERTLKSSNQVNARRAAALWLLNDKRSEALIAAAGDPEPRVRSVVAASFGPRRLRQLRVTGLGHTVDEPFFTPVLDAHDVEILGHLAADPDASVRRAAAFAAAKAQPPLAKDVYVALAANGDEALRKTLLTEMLSDNPALPEVLDVATRDSARELLKLALQRIGQATAMHQSSEDWFAPFLPAFLRVLRAPNRSELWSTGNAGSIEMMFAAAARAPGGLAQTARVIADTENDRFTRAWMLGVTWGGNGRPTMTPAFAELSDELVERAFRRATMDTTNFVSTKPLRGAKGSPACHIAAWTAIVADNTLSADARAFAASIGAPCADDAFETALLGLLRERGPFTNTTQDLLADAGESYDPGRAEALGLAIVRDPALTFDGARPVLQVMYGKARYASWSKPVLARWLEPANTKGSLLGSALAALPPSDDAETVDYLSRALRTSLWYDAVAAMGAMRKPVYLDLLAREFASDAAGARTSEKAQIAITDAIAGYLTPEAAERLLALVPLAVNEASRTKVLESLEQVRTYLDAKKRWSTRESDADKRGAAVNELVKLTDDPDAATRARAAKGLAALDAVEHLPKLIALLKDNSPDVRAAAQQALDVIDARAAQAAKSAPDAAKPK